MKTHNYLNSGYKYRTIYSDDNLTLYSKKSMSSNNIQYFKSILTEPCVIELKSLFNEIQFEIVLQYINSEKCNPIIINLLFSNNNIEKQLAINLIKK